MLEFIGICNGSRIVKDKEFLTFACAGVVGLISVAIAFSMGAEPGRRYLIRCVPRRYENKAFLAFEVVSEV